MKHYLMKTDADFERAAKSAAIPHGKASQDAETPATLPTSRLDLQGFANQCNRVHK
jgi:hypothetical protein